jgi:hypothetical protein
MDYSSGDAYRSALRPGKSRLGGTGRIADELWLIGHHEATGRPHLSPRALGVGVAGGLLAELMTAEVPAVMVHHGYVRPLYHRDGLPVARSARPDEPVEGHVLDLIMSEGAPLPARDWLLFLGRTAAADVAGRLERSGYLARQPGRRPWRVPPPVPVDRNWSHCALLRAHAGLEAGRELTLYSALLAGLVLACGLGFRFSDFPGAPGRAAEEAARALPRPLQELIAQVQLTSDQAVLSTRK